MHWWIKRVKKKLVKKEIWVCDYCRKKYHEGEYEYDINESGIKTIKRDENDDLVRKPVVFGSYEIYKERVKKGYIK